MPMPAGTTYSFGKPERLKSRKLIEQLFSNGQAQSAFPLKLLYSAGPFASGEPLQATVSVSKRNFKKAVDRNRIKRLMREAYRLRKTALKQQLADNNQQLVLFFIYTGKQLPALHELEKAMEKILYRIRVSLPAKDKQVE